MMLQPGTWVTETVRLEEQIAVGGMGEVWSAEHVTLGTKVAVKCLLSSIARRAGALRRFVTEAQIAARMNDPHTVHVLDCVVRNDDDGGPSAFIVMELLEGEDLGARLERGGVLSLHETIEIVQQVAAALSRARELGILHRDVKPENIFLSRHAGRLSVKLLDFGVAKDLTRGRGLTLVGVTLGTPQYMSPEQLAGELDMDARCDVWALAVVAYTCLTGRHPFEGRTVGAVHACIQGGQARPPSAERFDLPTSVDGVFVRAFHPDIVSRFQDARDLAEALADAGLDATPPVAQRRPVTAVTTSRVCVIEEESQNAGPIPFELVRPSGCGRVPASR